MWEYGEAGRLLTINSVGSDDCIYCQTPLLRLPAQSYEKGIKRLFLQLSICPHCGWWTVYRVHQNEHEQTSGFAESYSGSIGCLKELDLSNISVPLNEVRQYLLAKKDSAYNAHPRLLEEVVCSMFKDLGWSARVTAYSGDEGIDVILDGPDGKTVGVQVKRYKKERRIEAEQIRSLAGALLQGEHTRGIFITTSKYRKGAKEAAEKLTSIGHRIELIEAERFLEALGVAQHNSFKLTEEQAVSYIKSIGVHIGTGEHKDFVPGEDLRERQVIASLVLGTDLLDLRDDDYDDEDNDD
jgi:restriction system protein